MDAYFWHSLAKKHPDVISEVSSWYTFNFMPEIISISTLNVSVILKELCE